MIELPPYPYGDRFSKDSNREFLERVFRQRLIETFAVALVRFRGSGRWPETQREWEAVCDASGDLTPAKLQSLRQLYDDPALFALLCACAVHQLELWKEYWKRLDGKPLALKLVLAPQLAGVQPGADDMRLLEEWARLRVFFSEPPSAEDVKDRTQDAFEAVLKLLQAGHRSDEAMMLGSPPVFPLPLAEAEATRWERLIAGAWPQLDREITERLAPALDAESLSLATKRDLQDIFRHESRDPLLRLDSGVMLQDESVDQDQTEVVVSLKAPDEGPRIEARLDLAQLLQRNPIPAHVLKAIVDHETLGLTWEEAAKRHGTTRQTINKYLVRLRGAARKSS